MAAMRDPPFDEREQRFFLAEILKTSSMPPSELVKIIQDKNINPNWMDMLMPNGRSPASCAQTFERLTNRVSSIIAPGLSTIAYDRPASSQRPKKKRRSFEYLMPPVVDRTIQPQQQQPPPPHPPAQAPPQQYYFAPVNVNEPVDHAVHWNQSVPASQGEQPVYHGKKRGRPSKAEYEIKAREAAERGDPWPPPKKIKTPRPSIEGGSLLNEITGDSPGQAGPGELEATPASKKRAARKPKPALPAPEEIPPRTSSIAAQRNIALEATASAAEQMQINVYKDIVQNSVPEPQASGFVATENLVGETPTQGEQTIAKLDETPATESRPEQMDLRPDTARSIVRAPQEIDPASREERQERQFSPSNTY